MAQLNSFMVVFVISFAVIALCEAASTSRNDRREYRQNLVTHGTSRSREIHALEARQQKQEEKKQGDLKPAKIEALKPIIRPDATRLRLYFGPFTIPSQKRNSTTMNHAHNQASPASDGKDTDSTTISRGITGFCTNCTVLWGKADTYSVLNTSARATISSGVYNHHILVLDGEKQNLLPWYLCAGQTDLGKSKSAGFMITGVAEAVNWFTSPDGRFASGYWVGERQRRFTLNAELVNYNEVPTSVYITTEVEFVQKRLADRMDASMSLISVTGCKSPDFRPPKGAVRYNLTSPATPILKDGYILASTGHVHDGGTNIVLTLNGRVICDSKAVYGGDGSETVGPDGSKWETISGMTECNTPVEVQKGDMLVAEAVYDTKLHPLRQAAHGHGDGESMGTFFVNFAVKKPS